MWPAYLFWAICRPFSFLGPSEFAAPICYQNPPISFRRSSAPSVACILNKTQFEFGAYLSDTRPVHSHSDVQRRPAVGSSDPVSWRGPFAASLIRLILGALRTTVDGECLTSCFLLRACVRIGLGRRGAAEQQGAGQMHGPEGCL